jgi:beta-glucanase (GH16 family)
MEIRTAHPKTIFLTNQKASSRATPSTFQTSPHYDMTSDFHEYRFDWLPGVSKFYIDGAFVGSMKKNVPSVAGSVVWNNWANGGSWSGGPPVSDSFLEIKSVEMYFNRTSVRGVAC